MNVHILKRHIGAKGLGVLEFVRAVPVSKTTYYKYVENSDIMTLGMVRRFAEILELSREDVLAIWGEE